MPEEIITLQFGEFANCVGTHWWNIQESGFCCKNSSELQEIDSDVTFRDVETRRSETTYTPRLVLIDSKESLPVCKTLYEQHDIFREEQGHLLWNGEIEYHKAKPLENNYFLEDLRNGTLDINNGLGNGKNVQIPKRHNLEKTVQSWADFKRTHYHPKTTISLDTTYRETYDSYHGGIYEARYGKTLSNIEESVRFFAEECDSLQGFHIISDLHNGFGGIACGALEYLRDEYKEKTFASFPVLPQNMAYSNVLKSQESLVSKILVLSGLLELSSYTIPISLCSDIFNSQARMLPHLNYNASLNYHTSAVIAALLESLTRPYRTRQRLSKISNVGIKMTSGSRKLLGLSSAMPLPYNQHYHKNISDFLHYYADNNFWHSVTPNLENDGNYFSQNIQLSGISSQKFTSAWVPYQNATSTNPVSLMKLYMKERFSNVDCDVSVISEPIKVSAPFPQIFAPDVCINGNISPLKNTLKYSDEYTEHLLNANDDGSSYSKDFSMKKNCVESMPVMTVLECSPALSTLLNRCHKQGDKLMKWYKYYHSDHEIEYIECLEQLKCLETDYGGNCSD